MDEFPDLKHRVEDHPRDAEAREIWARLSDHAPPELRPIESIAIADMAMWFPARFENHLTIPVHTLAETTSDQLAFALAHAATTDFIQQFFDDAKLDAGGEPAKLERIPAPARDTVAKLLDTAEGIAAVGRWLYASVSESRERETARIKQAVTWLNRAGYDPNACVRYFLAFDDWLEEQNTDAPPVDPTKSKVAALLVTPFFSALHEATKDSPPLAFGADRAALARTVCVQLGYYPPR